MTHRLTLVRHGQSVANRNGIVQGHLDSPLGDSGRRQAAALAETWQANGLRFDHLLSSPLLRARQTAEILAAGFGLQLETDAVWMERDLGHAQGMALTDFLAASQRRRIISPFEPAFEDGESAWDLHTRAARAVQGIVNRPEGDYLIVSHGGILNAVLRVVLGIPPSAQRAPRFHFSNCGYARIETTATGSWALTDLVNPLEDTFEEDEGVMAPDEIIAGGKIHTLDSSAPAAQALALQRGILLAAGRDDEILPLAGQRTLITHLQGRTVLPGLIDAHLHLQHLALAMARLDCETATRDECLARVAERARSTPPGEWILGHGWNQNTWGSYPDRHALDEVAPHHPVYLTAKSLHAGWANTLALLRARIDRACADPVDGQLQRDVQGEPTGILLEGAMRFVASVIPAPSVEEVARALAGAQPRLWEVGLTGVHDFDGPLCFAALQTLRERGELGLRVLKSLPVDQLDSALELGLRSGFGDDWIRLGAVKVFADGALGPRTAAMLDDYEGEPGSRGTLLQDRETLLEIGRRALPAGLALAIHAIGDRANHEVLEAFSALARQPAAPGAPHMPSRIEHVQLLHPRDIGRLARLNLVASMQPIHATSDMEMAERHWGDRVRTSYAWHSLAQAGTRLVFGSDAPVESPNPFWGWHAAVTRRRQDGSPAPEGWLPQERLTRQEALLGFTRHPAELAGLGGRQGILRPGALADLIVLNRDPLDCAPEELFALRPCGTMVGGRWRYRDF